MNEEKLRARMSRKAFLRSGGALVGAALLGGLRSRAYADNTDLLQAAQDAWNAHDPDALVALFTEDCVYEDVTLGVVNHGTAELRAFAEGVFTAIPDVNFPVLSIVLKGSHGSLEWGFNGTDVGLYGTGKTFSLRGGSVIEVHGNKIARQSDYWDLATLLRQIGLLPPGL
jgi:steroid delta-isomerase-like uncharacterized protein